jgi:putative ABC transport system permease protein
MAFITTQDFAAHRGDSLAYVLVGAKPGVNAALQQQVAAALPGDTVQTRDGFVHQETALFNDMVADLMQIMGFVAFLIALAVIGLTLFTLTLAKMREHAIVKALGGPTRRLAAVVLAQAAWLVLLAVAVATALAIGLGALVDELNPAVTVAITPDSVIRVGVAALAIGALGAIAPLRRVVRIDPASAFRRAS